MCLHPTSVLHGRGRAPPGVPPYCNTCDQAGGVPTHRGAIPRKGYYLSALPTDRLRLARVSRGARPRAGTPAGREP
eukprot:5793430-Prymnesium_polylepis.1